MVKNILNLQHVFRWCEHIHQVLPNAQLHNICCNRIGKNFAGIFAIQNNVKILVFVIQVEIYCRSVLLRVFVESGGHASHQSVSARLVKVSTVFETKDLVGKSVDQIVLNAITLLDTFVLAFPVFDVDLSIQGHFNLRNCHFLIVNVLLDVINLNRNCYARIKRHFPSFRQNFDRNLNLKFILLANTSLRICYFTIFESILHFDFKLEIIHKVGIVPNVLMLHRDASEWPPVIVDIDVLLHDFDH